ncbi:cytochrome c3 family protein [Chloroflexota bacterium]
MRTIRTLLAVAALVALLSLTTATTYGLSLLQIPPVPHPVEGREDCLVCHDTGAVKPFPEDHQDRDNDSCTMCHGAGETEPSPVIPHAVEGREDCLDCHDIGGLKPFPDDHEGRGNDGCLDCHQTADEEPPPPTPEATVTPAASGESEAASPTPEPTAEPLLSEVVPTPIHEPVLFEENTCIACHKELGGAHTQITNDWEEGVHAAQGVGCVSCHGGDPTQQDAAASMSPEAGYLGPLSKEEIPGLCGSCHTRVDLMRPFDLPTDQLDQYWQSQHGQALLEGDPNVATCFDCHDGHRVLKTSDPASDVYPSNEPAMCAGCHADGDLMSLYGIEADQYDVYQGSVHGEALLQDQNLRAPTCSTCHGKHGAAPPGFEEVANVCGQCHATTQDYYTEGAHRTGMTGEAAPRCATCHGQHDVQPATRDLFLGTEAGRCGSCHPPGSEAGGQAEAMYQALTEADDAFEHAEATITLATENRLIMTGQEELLQQAGSPLIESRALQHTVNMADVQAKAEESLALSREAQASAEEAIGGLDTRRLGMIIAVVFILLTVVALVLIKIGLDRDLEAKRARRRGETD